jgi:ABC-type lipoprotein release transport system permease subunit
MTRSSTLRIAWRSLGRNRRRTALALAAIGLSQALVLCYGGLLRGYADWMVETITGPMLGHAQAHAPGWRRDRAMDRTLAGADRAVQALRRDPEIAEASARLYAPALAALGQDGHAVVVIGLEPAAEARPSGLLAGAQQVPVGRRVLLGRPLAEQLGVEAGDTLALMGQGADGSLANDLVTVAGLVSTPVDLVNRMGVLMNLRQAQELFAMPGAAHEIVIHVRHPGDAAGVAERAARLPELAGAEVLDWETLAPELVSLVQLVGAAWAFILVLVFLAAAAGVANTMLMATFERVHELGMLLALGATPARIVRLIVAESLVLGVGGALLGSALGAALVALAYRTGIDFSKLAANSPSQLSFAGMNVPMRCYPSLDATQVVQGILAVVVTSLLASIWPAVRAARLQPAQAMRA